MRISRLYMNNFKRFTDLTLEGIPEETKLVLLIGSNGSGKSSVFDGFEAANRYIKQDGWRSDHLNYYKKDDQNAATVSIDFFNNRQLSFSTDTYHQLPTPTGFSPNSFYGRTSFRQIPRLTRKALGGGGSFDIERDSDRPIQFIERDNRFENDIEKITEILLKEFFLSTNQNIDIKKKYVDPINEALIRIFGHQNGTRLQLIEIIPPLEGKVAQITFTKGVSKIHYDYLSAGEKEVFNILINLLTRREYYQDTIYFFDEIDLHLNTKLQFNLLKEITENWISPSSQLWTASHSLGFIEYARQSDQAVIFDFDDLDFDFTQTLYPETKENPDIYEIAVGKEFLPSLFKGMTIYFVENKDKEFYASLGIPQTVFVSDNNRNNVFHKVRSADNFQGIVDRDFLSDEDIDRIQEAYPRLTILPYYSIENYLFHPNNLEDYWKGKGKAFDKTAYVQLLVEEKNKVINKITPTIGLKRTEYPYFGEPEYNGSPLQNRFKNKGENEEQAVAIVSDLNSDDFETFYKSLPMKIYCTQLPQRQNISKLELAKTNWFKESILSIL